MRTWQAILLSALWLAAACGGAADPLDGGGNPEPQSLPADAASRRDASGPGGEPVVPPDAGADSGPDAAAPRPDASALAPDASFEPDASVPRPDASTTAPDASTPHPDASTSPGDGGLAPPTLALEVILTDTAHELMAVDPSGVAYALAFADSPSNLWASTDDGQTWSPRGVFPNHSFQFMNCLSDGVLIADTTVGSDHFLARSTDQGSTWSEVLALADRRMLQPHNVAELDGVVYYAEYQVTTETPVPINVWASLDDGATWTIRYTFQAYRHAHSLLADPATGALWVFMGDPTGETLRSLDEGNSWTVMIPGFPGVVVDAVLAPDGLHFGTDGLYQPAQPHIEFLPPDGALQILAALPGPSYSIHRVQAGGFLLGTTHETGGDVYPPGDDAAHLFSSVDGFEWLEVKTFQRLNESDYVRTDVYWDLPDGRAFVEFSNAQGFGSLGSGFILVNPVVQ